MPITSRTFVRSTALLLLVGLLSLLGIVGANVWLVERSQAYFEEITEARAVRRAAVDLRAMVQDLETGQRGYVITHDPLYLEPYNTALPEVDKQLQRLKNLLADYPETAEGLATLEADIGSKIRELDATIDEVHAGNYEAAVAQIRTDKGKQVMDRIRAFTGDLIESIDSYVQVSVGQQRGTVDALRWVTILGGLAILAVVSGAIWAVLSYTSELSKARRAVEEANAGLEDRVKERTSELGKANEEIQRFAYIVTHDLRAPLVNVMGFTSELESNVGILRDYMANKAGDENDPFFMEAKQAATEELPEAITFIRAATRKMDGLINAILKISREGRRQLRPELVNIVEVANTSAAAVHHQVVEGDGQITTDMRISNIVTDKLSIEQVLGNLLDNAIKYQQPGRPLRVAIRGQHLPGNRVQIMVEDNGRGIADTDHERVFELFRRSGAQSKPGEGIGLAHVRTMVRALGGDVTLSSRLGEGTTFNINLPRDLRTYMGTTNNE
jgi:CHASE3 domain sensor protein